MRAGEVVEHGGRVYPRMYTPTNQYLLDTFRIEPAEERQMRTIISRVEKDRRRAEGRWADGVKRRADSVERARPWATEGISRVTWYRRRARSAIFAPAAPSPPKGSLILPPQEVDKISITPGAGERDDDAPAQKAAGKLRKEGPR